MQNKFHAHFGFFPTLRPVRVVLFENILSGPVDLDLSGSWKATGKVIYNKQSRLILSSDTSLEGATPAADTLALLYKKVSIY